MYNFINETNKLINELISLEATTIVIDKNVGYIDGKLKNNHFYIIDIRNKFEAYVSISNFGIYRALMPIDKIHKLLRKLSQ